MSERDEDGPLALIIDLNWRSVVCRICGVECLPRFGVPMYEDIVLDNEDKGEWFGAPACCKCFDFHLQLGRPMSIEAFRDAFGILAPNEP